MEPNDEQEYQQWRDTSGGSGEKEEEGKAVEENYENYADEPVAPAIDLELIGSMIGNVQRELEGRLELKFSDTAQCLLSLGRYAESAGKRKFRELEKSSLEYCQELAIIITSQATSMWAEIDENLNGLIRYIASQEEEAHSLRQKLAFARGERGLIQRELDSLLVDSIAAPLVDDKWGEESFNSEEADFLVKGEEAQGTYLKRRDKLTVELGKIDADIDKLEADLKATSVSLAITKALESLRSFAQRMRDGYAIRARVLGWWLQAWEHALREASREASVPGVLRGEYQRRGEDIPGGDLPEFSILAMEDILSGHYSKRLEALSNALRAYRREKIGFIQIYFGSSGVNARFDSINALDDSLDNIIKVYEAMLGRLLDDKAPGKKKEEDEDAYTGDDLDVLMRRAEFRIDDAIKFFREILNECVTAKRTLENKYHAQARAVANAIADEEVEVAVLTDDFATPELKQGEGDE